MEEDFTGELTPVSADRNAIVEGARQSLDILASLVMPLQYRFRYPEYYLWLFHAVTTLILKPRDFSKYCLGLPRGFAKTAFLKLIVIWAIVFSKKRFILIVCSTESKAANFVADIATMLDEENFRKVFGDWSSHRTKNTQLEKEFSFSGRKLKLYGIGANSSVRGIVRNNERPDLQFLDDIQEREDAESPILSDKLLEWMLATLMETRSPFGCQYIFAGNMYPFPGSILRKLQESPDWTSFITGAILEDGTSLWEELHPVSQLLDTYKMLRRLGKESIFLAEYMNDKKLKQHTTFDAEQLKILRLAEADLTQGSFVVIDPSGRNKKSDDTAIGGFYLIDGKPHLKKLRSEVLTPKQTISAALIMATEIGASLIVVEAIAYQDSLIFWFEEAKKLHGLGGINIVPINPGGVSKNTRILTALKQLQAGEITIAPEVRSLVVNEASNFDPRKTNNKDNILDILAYAEHVTQKYLYLIAVNATDPSLLGEENPYTETTVNHDAFATSGI